MFNKMMEQQQAMKPMTPAPPNQQVGMPGQPPVLTVEEQNVLNSIQTEITSAPTSNEVQPTQSKCPECGLFHPSTGGKPCPNASIANESLAISDAKVNTYLVQWRNILLAHIEKLNIKEWEKIFQKATLILAKEFDGSNND